VRRALVASTNPDFLGWCHWCLGSIALLSDRVDSAATELARSLELGESVDDDSLRAHAGSALALVTALRDDPDTAKRLVARAVHSAERMVGAPRVLMMALAHASQVAVLTGDTGGAAALVTRLLAMLRDRGATYWAGEALDAAAVVLTERSPQDAGLVLCAGRPIEHGDGRLIAMREHLERCRTRLASTLGPRRWGNTVRQAGAMPVEEVVIRALMALRAPEAAASSATRAVRPGRDGIGPV
jgi:ATP/maltotriose-dependent transcriptional regulator MalT